MSTASCRKDGGADNGSVSMVHTSNVSLPSVAAIMAERARQKATEQEVQ